MKENVVSSLGGNCRPVSGKATLGSPLFAIEAPPPVNAGGGVFYLGRP